MVGTVDHDDEVAGNGGAPPRALPLDGIRIVDFSRLLPGPWCTQMLADLGAEVIKIEQPGVGDMSRHNAPNYAKNSVYFNSVNRGKRSLALDLGKLEGRKIAFELIERADVVIESFRRGVPERLGIDFARVRKINPSLIYCSITGFGQSGPLAPIPGHDLVIQAVTGLMGTALQAGAAPAVPGFQAADYAGGACTAIGILSALLGRGRSGQGRYLDISMFDSLFSMCNIVLTGAMARAAGQSDPARMEVWGANPRYATYVAQDGKPVAVTLLETRTWERFCHLIGQPGLIADDESPSERHSAHGERTAAYRDAIATFCASRPRDRLIEEMRAADIPFCPINTPDEALASEHVAARGLIEWIEHPIEGRIPQLANPLASSGLVDSHRRPAPDLGADRDSILDELGYAAPDREKLLGAGIVA
jgi:crotonobetainyl-CoA:carnitine CoA-transferase CaiB-like acyl-CoA transferase